MEENSVNIFSRICRTCLSETANLQSIFEAALNERITELTLIQVIVINFMLRFKLFLWLDSKRRWFAGIYLPRLHGESEQCVCF